ncbi:hypothetical protein CRG98_005583 [Punica granatum]|uniref:Uncharacterized protein n=1 Tax=Punica granatum TaxID=22663 RepID=A0A2I0L055_PUNGR|nr:hypothetical protein CRG98_005583 [Punica granatum]
MEYLRGLGKLIYLSPWDDFQFLLGITTVVEEEYGSCSQNGIEEHLLVTWPSEVEQEISGGAAVGRGGPSQSPPVPESLCFTLSLKVMMLIEGRDASAHWREGCCSEGPVAELLRWRNIEKGLKRQLETRYNSQLEGAKSIVAAIYWVEPNLKREREREREDGLVGAPSKEMGGGRQGGRRGDEAVPKMLLELEWPAAAPSIDGTPTFGPN